MAEKIYEGKGSWDIHKQWPDLPSISVWHLLSTDDKMPSNVMKTTDIGGKRKAWYLTQGAHDLVRDTDREMDENDLGWEVLYSGYHKHEV